MQLHSTAMSGPEFLEAFADQNAASGLDVNADIGLRMLTPRELYRAQGFPETYIIDRGVGGKKLPKDAQVRACGNSVCPPMARALVEANVGAFRDVGVEAVAA